MIERLPRILCGLVLIASWSAGMPCRSADDAGPQPPDKALAAMTVAPDLQLEQVLAEPTVRQPVFLNFDERGRMWVVNYIQYPFPAGLKILSEDKFLRATYDKVPPPPPNHFPGQDKITIHEDTDGDGAYDKHSTFVEGLNIVSAVTRGRGGVWVINPPYLLFYPDRDNNDAPDGDPEVHLEGFGMEDTHSVANSLQWGPDGWLYAAQGSTVSGQIKRPGADNKPVHSMGQLIWRYHPETRRYEIFAEGGGNAFGVEIDSVGRIYSGHNGGDTRGFHYVQGAYLQKGFGKHGPLSNPYAFGYFPPMKHAAVPRFTHNFVIYEGGALPAAHRGKLFGVAPLQSHVVESDVQPDGSTFQTTDVGHPVQSSDPWFRPVDIKVGPDGAIYVADFHEGNAAHLRHHEGKIDNTTGRIYRLKAPGAAPLAPFDLSRNTTDELVKTLEHPNKWFRRMALRILGDRRDGSATPALSRLLAERTDQTALEALWGLNAVGDFNDQVALQALAHANPYVRVWGVRLLGDARQVSPEIAARLKDLATSEPHVEVRSQLASSARRLPAADGLPIVRQLLAHSEDASDGRLPLLCWWAIESKAETDRQAVVDLFADSQIWTLPVARQHILSRAMRRYALAGTRHDLQTCAQLLLASPDAESSKELLKGFEEAYQGRSLTNLPNELVGALAKVGGGSTALGLRQGQPQAVETALAAIADDQADKAQRLQYVRILGEVKQPHCIPALLDLLPKAADDELRIAALNALQLYDDPRVAEIVLSVYGELSDDARAVAQTLLSSRKSWTLALLQAVDQGQVPPTSLPLDVVRKLSVHRDDTVTSLVARHWGAVEGATTGEMKQIIERMEGIARSGSGSPYEGKKLFSASCAKCHRLFGQGGQIGPDLTAFKRDDIGNMLLNIVNPSAEVREGFETFMVITDDGRALSGFLVDKDNQVVVLRGIDGQNATLATDEIEEMAPTRKSLMPEGLLANLSEQQVRDLLAYLRSTQPLNE